MFDLSLHFLPLLELIPLTLSFEDRLNTTLFIVVIPFVVVLFVELLVNGKDNSLAAMMKDRRNFNFEFVAGALSGSHLFYHMSNVSVLGAVSFIEYQGAVHSLELLDTSRFGWNYVLASIGGLLFFDFTQYWCHRLNHTVKLLWIPHRYHHAARELCAMTSIRLHPLSAPIKLVLVSLPAILLFGTDVRRTIIYWFFQSVGQAFAHSRWNTDYGWLGKIFVSPRFHRRHHVLGDHECNYSFVFTFWDHLFGTYKDDRKAFAMKVGTEKSSLEHRGVVIAFFHVYVDMLYQMGADIRRLFLWLGRLFDH